MPAVSFLTGVLFCRFCSHSLEFDKLDTVQSHLVSAKHVKAKAAGKITMMQAVIPCDGAMKDSKSVVILDFVRMLASADIPINKVEKMLPFIRKHCVQGGWVPKETQLRRMYVPAVCMYFFILYAMSGFVSAALCWPSGGLEKTAGRPTGSSAD